MNEWVQKQWQSVKALAKSHKTETIIIFVAGFLLGRLL